MFSTTELRFDIDCIGHFQFAHDIQKTEVDIDYIEETQYSGLGWQKLWSLQSWRQNIFVLTLLIMLDISCIDKRQGNFLLLNSILPWASIRKWMCVSDMST